MSSLLSFGSPKQLQAISPSPTRSGDANVFADMIATNYLLYDIIFAATSPSSILRLSRTCRVALAATRDYFTRAFNINKHLTRFFDDPLAFRSLQARTTTLISGSFALQFFDRTVYEDSDLDLYVSLRHRQDVGHWLLAEGYQYSPNSVQNPDFDVASDENHLQNVGPAYVGPDARMIGVAAVFTFHKPSPVSPDKKLQVQVIVAKRSPIEVILRFHSTLVLNVISWDRAYSLYPCCTFEHRKAILFRHSSHKFGEVLQKYSDRGFEFTTTRANTHLSHDPAIASQSRWIGDKHSWVFELPTEGVTLPPPVTELSRPLTRDPCYLATWRRVDKNFPTAHSTIAFEKVGCHNALHYEYVVLAEEFEEPMFQIIARTYRKWLDDRAQSKDPKDRDGPVEYYDQYLIEACEEAFEKDEKWRMWSR